MVIRQLGQDIGESFSEASRLAYLRKKLSLESIDKLKTFMSLPADKRKALLADPSFRQDIIKTLDPDTFLSRKKGKKALADQEGMSQRNKTALALGEPTVEEVTARTKAKAEADKAASEARFQQQKENIAAGREQATPMSLLMHGVTDPIANSLFALVPDETRKNIALAEKKLGPIYQQQQLETWYKWGMDQGFQPGLAYQTAAAISQGAWDKVPVNQTDYRTGKQTPVRGKAEIELANQTLQAQARMQEVSNARDNAIATSTMQLAEKSGLTPDQARADVMAIRAGKPAPFPTTALTQHIIDDLIIRKQEIEKNTQTILNDQAGLAQINDALKSMTQAYKDSGYFSGAQGRDLEDKIKQTREELTKRLAMRYGIKYDTYEDLHPLRTAVGQAMGSVWKGAKTTGYWGIDLAKDAAVATGIDEGLNDMMKGFTESMSPIGEAVKGTFQTPQTKVGTHTPEQERILGDLMSE